MQIKEGGSVTTEGWEKGLLFENMLVSNSENIARQPLCFPITLSRTFDLEDRIIFLGNWCGLGQYGQLQLEPSATSVPCSELVPEVRMPCEKLCLSDSLFH